MSLLTITNIEDGTPVTANTFNQRFGKIASVLNGGLDATNFEDGGIPAEALSADIFSRVYPIGSVYINATSDANPLTLFGFGTWVAFGAGQVPVGIDVAQTEFNSPEKTGGGKTHTLTTAEMPDHNHAVNDPGHSHGMVGDPVFTSATGSQRAYAYGSGQQLRWSVGGVNSATTGVTTANKGSGAAHNNLQPYITVYMWKRTG